jgi:hypothetical protein
MHNTMIPRYQYFLIRRYHSIGPIIVTDGKFTGGKSLERRRNGAVIRIRPEKKRYNITTTGEGLLNISITCSALKGVLAGRDVYRVTPAVTWGLGFSGLIRRTAAPPFSRLSYDTQGCVEDKF